MITKLSPIRIMTAGFATMLVFGLSVTSIKSASTRGKDPTGTSGPSIDIDSDEDGISDTEDAVPDDPEINWAKTTDSHYVWLEQVPDAADQGSPRAVNKRGQILFYTDGYPSTHDKVLWNSATRAWVDLIDAGSKELQINGNIVTNHYAVNQFIDINDDGTIFGISLNDDIVLPHTLAPGMLWMKGNEAGTMYNAPKGIYPQYPVPVGTWEIGPSMDIRNARGSIANDGSVNTLSIHYGVGPSKADWMIYDGPGSGFGMDAIRPISQNLKLGITFPGAILDKNHALFVETVELTQNLKQRHLWLKEGATQTDLSFMVEGHVSIAEMSFTPNFKDDNGVRLWITTGSTCFLEKRAGGTGSGRWHKPPSMNEGAFCMNSRGEALAASKIWRNGKYSDLNVVTSKPPTVTIDEAIDLASNGIILARATENGSARTGLLLPVDLVAYKCGTIDAPGVEQPKGNGEYGYEIAMMENADSEDNATGKRDCDTALVDRAKDDDFVKIVLHYPGLKIEGASLELKHEAIAVDSKIKGSEMDNPEDAFEVLDTGSRLKFYREDGTLIEDPDAELKIADLKNPGSGYLAQILDPVKNGKLTLFIEGADDFGSVGPSLGPAGYSHENDTIADARTAAKKLGGTRLKFAFEMGNQKTEIPLLVYRGGFLAFKQPSGSPGVVGTFEFWDGKGRVRHKYSGHEDEFQEDDTDWGVKLKSWSAKSGKTTGKDYNLSEKNGHAPPGWWINYERTVLSGNQNNTSKGEGASKKITQGSYCRWQQDDAAAEGRYTEDYKYDASKQKDASIGEPTSISFKFELLPLPPSSGQSRTDIQIHPDGKQDGTAGCIGIQKYDECLEIRYVLRSYNNLKTKVETK